MRMGWSVPEREVVRTPYRTADLSANSDGSRAADCERDIISRMDAVSKTKAVVRAYERRVYDYHMQRRPGKSPFAS